MYLRYEPWSKIEAATSLTKNDINSYATRGGWRAEREAIRSDIIDAATESKRGVLLSISKHGLEIVDKAIQQLRDDVISGAKKLNVMEIDKVQSIVTNFDKIVKLDQGEATERHEVIQPASVIELQKALEEMDPFLEDAKFKELPLNEKSVNTNGTATITNNSDNDIEAG